MSATPHTSNIIRQSQHEWGLIPAFSGPAQDAWIEERDGYHPVQQTGLTQLHKYSLSPFGRSLPKFELSKFDGSALAWSNWIGRFKNIVHDQPFLSNGHRLAYLQYAVTGSAKAEIQLLGEDEMNYALALRMLKYRFADAGRFVRAAITH